MSDDLELPRIFHEHDPVTYTAEQLQPTLQRLRAAVADVEAEEVTPTALTSAWTRIAELRLPRKAVPQVVLSEVEDLVIRWDQHAVNGSGGIASCAYALSEVERSREAGRIRSMLAAAEAASESGPRDAVYRSE